MCSDRPKQWDLCLAPAEFAYNNMVNHSTGKTPFFVLYQKPPNHTLDLVPLPKIPGYNIAAKNFAEKIEAIQADVRLKLEASNAKYKEDRDEHHRTEIYTEDDLVMNAWRCHVHILSGVNQVLGNEGTDNQYQKLRSLQMVCWWAENPNGDEFRYHLAKVPDYIWIGEDGMTMNCFGSQAWDWSLSTQAILSSNMETNMVIVSKRRTST
nr:squalene cyclase [Tanacetum cinerariifolium]